MNQISILNSARYVKLYIIAAFVVALVAAILATGGIKWQAKPLGCDDVVYAQQVGHWSIPFDANGQTVKLSTISAWNELSQTARHTLAVQCRK